MTTSKKQQLMLFVKKKKIKQILSQMEYDFNLNLIKLLGFSTNSETRNILKKELSSSAMKLSILTLRDGRHISPKSIFNWMYYDSFGDYSIQNIKAILQLLCLDNYHRNNTSPSEINMKLKKFHREFARKISKNDPGLELITVL